MSSSPVQVVVIDDETHCIESLCIQLEALPYPIAIVRKLNEAGKALEYLRTNTADIVFLDIEMPEMSGFDLLNKLTHFAFDVVFTTAYDQYAIKAFDYSALSYLLKPIDEADLQDAIVKWQSKKQKFLRRDQLGFLLEMIKGDANTRVALPTSEGLEFIEIADIIRCQSENNYTYIYLTSGQSHLICRTLKDVEQILRPHQFTRIHQSHLINLQHLKRFIRTDGGYVVMRDEIQLSISRAYKQQLHEAIARIERL